MDKLKQSLSEVYSAIDSKKGEEIRFLDLRKVCSFTDFFVICQGNNSKHNQAICDEIVARLKKNGERPASIEGYENAEWILVDFLNFVVHIFAPETRTFYKLEKLWSDAEIIQPDALTA